MRSTPNPPRIQLRTLTELALAIALATVLDLVSKSMPMPRALHGGSISLHMLPILVVAFRHGWRLGALAGAGYGVVNFLLGMHIIHLLQPLLDYPVAFGAVGLAGLGAPRPVAADQALELTLILRLRLSFWIVVGNGGRFLAHFLSGIIFWAQYAPPDQPVWIWSLLYNGAYMAPETILDILLLQLMLRRIFRYVA